MVAITACYAVGPVSAPRAYLTANEPLQVWVTAADSVLLVERPQLLGDTLVGFVAGAYRELSLTELREIRARRFNAGRTAALLAGLVAAVGVVGVMMRRRRSRPTARGAGPP